MGFSVKLSGSSHPDLPIDVGLRLHRYVTTCMDNMSRFANYKVDSSDYDTTRVPIGLEIILGCLT